MRASERALSGCELFEPARPLVSACEIGEAPVSPPSPLGANSPPFPSALPAGQRGCSLGSQSALSRPLHWRSLASLINSWREGAPLERDGGWGMPSSTVAT